MKLLTRWFRIAAGIVFILSISVQGIGPAAAQEGGGVRTAHNPQTGKLSFIGAEPGRPIVIPGAAAPGLAQRERALAMIQPYAADLGLRVPGRELELKKSRSERGREITRFQQIYQGVPVMAGELVVNATDKGGMLSINGEIAPDLTLDVTPGVPLGEARQTALQAMARAHGGEPQDYSAAQPALWVYDPRLLHDDGRPPMLVWRMDVHAKDGSQPVNELVLIDAQRGGVRLNFNQIDTSWNAGPGAKAAQRSVGTLNRAHEFGAEVAVVAAPPAAAPSAPLAPLAPLASSGSGDRYVSTAGVDSGDCTNSAAPCLTINYAIGQANDGETIKVAAGTYTGTGSTPVVDLNKNLDLSGGWNDEFTLQGTVSILDGADARPGISVSSSAITSINRVWIKNGYYDAFNAGGLRIGTNADVLIEKVTISDGRGGINAAQGASLDMRESVVAGNSGATNGGALWTYGAGSILIRNSVIAGNSATSSGGGIYGSSGTSLQIQIQNTIIANNTASNGPNCYTPLNTSVVSLGYSLVETSSGCSFSTGTGDVTGADPVLGPLDSTWGYMPLLAGSPAIDAGNPAAPDGNGTACDATDQLNRSRAIDGDGDETAVCDIGAYEYAPVGAADAVEAYSGSGQGRGLSEPFRLPLRARVTDATGLPLSGLTVTFTAPASGASGTFTASGSNVDSAITDGFGLATTSVFTANGDAGSYMVSAEVAGVVTPATFSLQNAELVPTTLETYGGTPQAADPLTAFIEPLSARARDQLGDPMQGIEVTFTAPASGASGTFLDTGTATTTAITDSSGIATASTFTANADSGAYVVEATFAGLGSPAAFQLENAVRVPTELYIYDGTPQLTIISTAFAEPLSAVVLDQAGNPLQGVTVNFAAPASGASATFADSASNITTALTDADGVAVSSALTANGTWGDYLATASVAGIATAAGFQLSNWDGHTWFVSTTGADVNHCKSALLPCLTINGAIGKAAAGDSLRVASGVYSGSVSPIVTVSKNLSLQGGWNEEFSLQTGSSIVDGSKFRMGISITAPGTVSFSRFVVRNSDTGMRMTSGTVTLSNSALNGNFDFSGGPTGAGISGTGGTLTVVNTTISQNSGTGVFFTGTALTLNNTTIAFNAASPSGGVGGIVVSDSSTVTVRNSILAGNTGMYADCSGILDTTDHSFFGSWCGESGAGGNLGGDPLLTTYAIGSPPYHALSAGSTAIDAGNPANCSSSDQRGVSRPQGAACDMGAYEDAPPGTAASVGVVSGSGQRAGITHRYSNPLVAYVIDSQGTIMPGVEVTFGAPDSGASGIFLDTAGITTASTTGADGTATSGVLTANDVDGAFDVIASAPDAGISANFSLLNVTPTTIGVSNGSPQGTRLYKAFTSPLSALVKDQFDQPIPGVLVTFTAPAAGASLIFSDSGANTSSATTNASGIATSASMTANGIAGAYSVQAEASPIAAPALFAMTNSFPDIRTYSMNNGTGSLPGTFRCDLSAPGCTNGADPHADAAQANAYAAYEFFRTNLLRDSIDDAGMAIVSSVHYGSNVDNAYWDGDAQQMIYGDHDQYGVDEHGWPLADDVVGHELTHGITQDESNLYYYYQSGAINESLSDVFGELFDQANGIGDDASGVRWQLGEDISGLGTLRSMSDPPAYGGIPSDLDPVHPTAGDPDRMLHANYYEGEVDNGGVHENSGVNNKAVYLMVDGGTFNSKTITPIGAHATLALYYEAQRNLLTSGSDYADLYNLVQQACWNLQGGAAGLTPADCGAVKDALDSVEMYAQPVAGYNTEAPLCGPGTVPSNVYYNSFESGTTGWLLDGPRWQWDSIYGNFARTGLHHLYADDLPQAVADVSARMNADVLLPANAYLHFAHAYDFEHYEGSSNNYDGGVLEYSTNGGASWNDAGALGMDNGYDGPIFAGYPGYPEDDNPLKGRQAFVRSSHGYISTRVNLSTLAGSNVRFRWRMGLDYLGFGWGWWLDDVRIYTCPAGAIQISGHTDRAGTTLNYFDGAPQSVVTDSSGNYSINVPHGWSGTVTPSKVGYIFAPSSKGYVNLSANQYNQHYTSRRRPAADMDADAIVDLTYFRPSTGLWGALKSTEAFSYGSPFFKTWGQTGDIIVPGDFDGDGMLDPTVRRPPGGGQSAAYLMLLSSTDYNFAQTKTVPAGWPGLGDTPAPGDFNGDGITDPAIFRGNTGVWIIPLSPNFSSVQFAAWGMSGDKPVAADVDGDGTSDIGFFRPSTGTWGFLLSSEGFSYASPSFFSWGSSTSTPVMKDYDGDGLADPAYVTPPSGGQSAAYRILLSSTGYDFGQSITIPAGWPGLQDTPVPNDYDGDGKADAGIWRGNTGVWIIPKSSTNNTVYMYAAWGANGDQVVK